MKNQKFHLTFVFEQHSHLSVHDFPNYSCCTRVAGETSKNSALFHWKVFLEYDSSFCRRPKLPKLMQEPIYS